MNPRAGFVQCIYCLVRQIPVGNVACRQLNTGINRFGRVYHIVMIFISAFDIFQNFNGLLNCCGFNQNFLKASLQCTVFFNMLAVLVKRCCANALNFTACQSRFQHICCIQRACCAACSNNSVNFINEKYDIIYLGKFIQNRLHAFFKLTAVFGSCHNRSDVETHHPFVEQNAGNFLLHNAQGKSFRNGRFPNSRLANQNGIVLFPAAQNLCKTLNFNVASYNRVEAVLFSQTGNICSEIIQNGSIGFG